jgi:tetratricopeptide (TPR) repeat protein
MSPSAKILPFPSRPRNTWLSTGHADLAARDFLAIPIEQRSDDDRSRFLCSPDILLALCSLLKRNRDLAPASVLRESLDIYHWISRPNCDLGLFDERDYLLGEVALIAGGVCRQLGKREEGFLWLDRAEAGFRHTLNPAPGLANVAYARLALRFEMGRYQDVLELTPSLEASFTKLRMELEAAKCCLLLAMTLKQTGENARALELLDGLEEKPALKADQFLRARILSEVGDLHQFEGRLDLAMVAFQKAVSLLEPDTLSAVRADLQLFVGGILKAEGRLEDARDTFRAAQRTYLALEMRPQVAYLHLVIAETLLGLKRDREAEWEILSALPAIEEMKMAPEGLAAVALLHESVRQRRTDPATLRHLQTLLQSTS